MTGMQRVLEVGLIICGAFAVFLFLALVSFHPADPSWSQTGFEGDIHNAAGAIGAWFADALLFAFGFVAYLLPFGFAALGYLAFQRPHHLAELDYLAVGLRIIGLVLSLVGASALASINFDNIFDFSAGGVVGDVISSKLLPYFNLVGTTLLLLTFLTTGLTLLSGLSWIALAEAIGAAVITATSWLLQWLKKLINGLLAPQDSDTDAKPTEREVPTATSALGLPADSSTYFAPPLDDVDPVDVEQRDQTSPNTKRWYHKLWPFGGTSSPAGTASMAQEPALDDAQLEVPLDERGRADEPTIDLDGLFGTTAKVTSHTSASETARFHRAQREEAEQRADEMAIASQPAPAVTSNATPKPAAPAVNDVEDAAEDSPETFDPLPSLALLDRKDRNKNPISEDELAQVSRAVEAVLQDFGVDAKVANVQPGPVVTRFELDLAPGVKVSKVSNLDKDIARSLSVEKVRVVEVIPGKSYVGLEIPNKYREMVTLSEVLSSDSFHNSQSPLTMVLGASIAGQPVVVDLGKMPHLLVAGTTGSGKSVGVNVMILSLLYKSTPEDVRMIMIDPKMLELSVYEGIPHLLTEVVTDMKDAANALRWCVGEMERRYKLMSALGVRNLKGYNAKVMDAKDSAQPLRDPLWKPGDSMDELPPLLEKLPNIVVVIDEFADMMMIVGKKVEELIARIAQKARAAGIHLVLATQRPSVDVITGLIKANIPTRIAFTVQSKIDSRTILDQPGADQLLGAGDMLYLAPGSGVPMRVHGAFVDDHEVHAVVKDWKKRGRPQYIEEILNGDMSEENLLPGEQLEFGDGEGDELYDEAVAFVTETRRVSVSSVQRKFRIGYNRAARIVEQMEASGVVTAAGSNGQREVLAPKPPRD